jgi:hypothetical protein
MRARNPRTRIWGAEDAAIIGLRLGFQARGSRLPSWDLCHARGVCNCRPGQGIRKAPAAKISTGNSASRKRRLSNANSSLVPRSPFLDSFRFANTAEVIFQNGPEKLQRRSSPRMLDASPLRVILIRGDAGGGCRFCRPLPDSAELSPISSLFEQAVQNSSSVGPWFESTRRHQIPSTLSRNLPSKRHRG